MRISFEGKFGIGLGLVGLAGTGALVVAPAPWVTGIGWLVIALAALGAILLAYHHLKENDRSMTPLVGMIFFGTGFAICLIWSFSQSNKITDESLAALADPAIFIECLYENLPSTMPPEGRLYILTPFPIPITNGGGGFMQQSGTPGGKLSWGTSPFSPQAFKCFITNYGSTPVIDMVLTFGITFKEAIRTPGPGTGATTGNVVLSRDWVAAIAKIDSGKASPFVFYIRNTTDKWLHVDFPKSVSLKLLGEEKVRSVTLSQAESGGMFMDLAPILPEPPPHKLSK